LRKASPRSEVPEPNQPDEDRKFSALLAETGFLGRVAFPEHELDIGVSSEPLDCRSHDL